MFLVDCLRSLDGVLVCSVHMHCTSCVSWNQSFPSFLHLPRVGQYLTNVHASLNLSSGKCWEQCCSTLFVCSFLSCPDGHCKSYFVIAWQFPVTRIACWCLIEDSAMWHNYSLLLAFWSCCAVFMLLLLLLLVRLLFMSFVMVMFIFISGAFIASLLCVCSFFHTATGGTVSLVQGDYAYHHYMQDRFNDDVSLLVLCLSAHKVFVFIAWFRISLSQWFVSLVSVVWCDFVSTFLDDLY